MADTTATVEGSPGATFSWSLGLRAESSKPYFTAHRVGRGDCDP